MVDTRKDLHVFPGVKATLVSSSNLVSSSHRTLAFFPFILKTKPVKSSVVAYVSGSLLVRGAWGFPSRGRGLEQRNLAV